MDAHRLSLLAVTDTGLADHQGMVMPLHVKSRRHFLHGGGPGASAGVGVLVDTSHMTVRPTGSVPARVAPFVQFYSVRGPELAVTLGVVYIPPRLHTRADLRGLRDDVLAAIRDVALQHPGSFLLLGDLNVHLPESANRAGVRRGHRCRAGNRGSRQVLDLLRSAHLNVLNGDQRFSLATPTYDSAARDPSTGAHRYTTLVDYAIASDATADGITDVYTTSVSATVPTDHRMVVTVMGVSKEAERQARQCALLHSTDTAPRLPGVAHPVWRAYRKAVDAHLSELRTTFLRLPSEGTPIRLPADVSVEHLLMRLTRVLKRHLHPVRQARRQHRYYTPPDRRRVAEAEEAAKEAAEALARLQEATRTAAVRAALPLATRQVRHTARQLATATAAYEQAERRATHAAASTALYSRAKRVKHLKYGHRILMACEPNTQRHGAGVSNRMPTIRHPATGADATTAETKVEAFSERLRQLHQPRPPHPPDVAANRETEESIEPEDQTGPGGLNIDFTPEEVMQQLQRLKLHKSGGAGGLNANILRGGRRARRRGETGWSDELCEWLALLFNTMLRRQEVPEALVRGEVTFVAKPRKPDPSDTAAWRPITVLPAIGKLFEGLVGERVRAVLESGTHGRHLDEGQFGFRCATGCPEALLTVVELRRLDFVPADDDEHEHGQHDDPYGMRPPPMGRPQRSAHMVFCDLKSAFDVVDHDALFRRLAAAGIRGRVWGVLRAMYRAHTRVVKIGRRRGHPIDINTGVPQGFSSSPLLYAAYLMLLATVIKSAMTRGFVDTTVDIDFSSPPPAVVDADGNVAAHIGPVTLVSFADDCVLRARNPAQLELALRTLAWGLHRLKCQLNVSKTWQLVSSMATRAQLWWKVWTGPWGHVRLVPDGELQRTTSMTRAASTPYLGVEVDSRATLRAHRQTTHEKTRRELRRAGAVVSSHGVYSPRIGVLSLHSAYSHLLYCCEVWSECGPNQPTHVATATALGRACARVLEVQGAPHLYATGELGMLSPTARIYQQRLALWMELLTQPPTRYTQWVYVCSLRAYSNGYEGPTWCKSTHAMLHHLGGEFTAAWADGDLEGQRQWLAAQLQRNLPAPADVLELPSYRPWRARLRRKASALVQEWASEQWRAQVQQSHTLRLFAKLHPRLQFARYLDCVHAPAATRLRAQLRSGWYPLQEHLAYKRSGHRTDSDQYRDEARCKLCGAPQETVPHFVLHCPVLAHARAGASGLGLRATIEGACTHPDVRALLTPAAVTDDDLLALTLGGDLSDRRGLESFMQPGSEAAKHPDTPHPARDRLAALAATGPILTALHAERTSLLARLDPAPDAAGNGSGDDDSSDAGSDRPRSNARPLTGAERHLLARVLQQL